MVIVAAAAMVLVVTSTLVIQVYAPRQTTNSAETEIGKKGFDVSRRAALDKIMKQEMDDAVYSERSLQTIVSYLLSTTTNKIYVNGETIPRTEAKTDVKKEIETDVISEMDSFNDEETPLPQSYRFKAETSKVQLNFGELRANSPASKVSEKITLEQEEAQIVLRMRAQRADSR